MFVHDWRALRHGTLALFNFHQFLGIPHLAAGQTAVLYPPVYAAVGLSRLVFGHYFFAIDLLVIGQLAAGAAGAFLLLRRLDVTSEAALFGAISWALGPYAVLVSAFWASTAPAVMLLPWMTLFSMRTLERGRPRDLAALVAARTLLLFAGYPELFLYSMLFEAVFSWCASPRKFVGGWLASLPLTALTASPLLIPLWQQVRVSAERAAPLSYRLFAHEDVAPGLWLRGLLWPFGGFRGLAPAAAPHVGWPGLGFALAGAVFAFERRPKRWVLAALASAAIAVIWACGGLDRALYALPLLNRFRFHFKLLLFGSFSLALLAAFGLSRLKLPRAWALAAAVLQGVNLVAVAALAVPGGLAPDSARLPLRRPDASMLSGGRIASAGRLRPAPQRYSALLGFDYATLWELDHFAGYDPLVPAGNFVEVDGLNEDSIIEREFLDRERLADWGVTRLVVDARDAKAFADALEPDAVELGRDADRVVYELPAARPMAYRAASRRPLPVSFGINDARVALDGAAGPIVLNVFENPGFSARVDGRAVPLTFTPDRKLAVDVPDGAREAVFSYGEPGFLLGLALAAACCLAFWLWSRHAGA